ncbi:MAG: hypothetical protein WAM28_09110 [Chlamydiales bacterium]
MFPAVYLSLLEQSLDCEAMMAPPSPTIGVEEEESRIENTFNFEGKLKTAEKEYTFKEPKLPPLLKQGHTLVPQKSLLKLPSPMEAASQRTLSYSQTSSPQFRPTTQTQYEPPATPTAFATTKPQDQPKTILKHPQQAISKETSQKNSSSILSQIKEKKPLASPRLPGRQENQKPSSSPFLQSHRWVHHEETKLWWQKWYEHREGGQEEQRERQDQEDGHEEGQKNRVEKTGRREKLSPQADEPFQTSKPRLAPPQIGVFALYYILTKIGILSDGASNFSYANEVSYLDRELTATRQKRLEELKAALSQEQSACRWSIAYKVFSWLVSMLGLLTGAAMISSGVGAFGGAMLMAAGIIQMTNQIMEITGTWQKIAAKLPGDDPDRKRAIISWIQIGITVLCLILAGSGLLFGGFNRVQQVMGEISMNLLLFQAIAQIGQAITSFGVGLTSSKYLDKLAEVRKYDIKLEKLKYNRRDLIERVDWGINRLEQLFEDLARVLGFYTELFRAEQRINKN